MKSFLTALFASASLLATGAALADRPGDDWISIEQAIEKVRGIGYVKISEIEADDGGWEGQGYKKGEEEYEFRLDGKTGEVERDEED